MAETMKRKLVTTAKGIDEKKYFVKFLIIAKTVTLDARTTEEKIERTLEPINNIMSLRPSTMKLKTTTAQSAPINRCLQIRESLYTIVVKT